jgi:hypothetical protein
MTCKEAIAILADYGDAALGSGRGSESSSCI